MDFILPKYTASFIVKVGDREEQFTHEGDVPEKIMDAYKQVVGDGLAKVSVSADFGIKDFGKGVSSMATVTLTCGQDENSIRRAYELASELAREFAHFNTLNAATQYREIVAQSKTLMTEPR